LSILLPVALDENEILKEQNGVILIFKIEVCFGIQKYAGGLDSHPFSYTKVDRH